MNKIADLAYWITERQAMKMRRESGMPPPWSADPAMANVRYCNVHREDDLVTKYLQSAGWRNVDHPMWVIVLARMINYIPALQYVHEGLDLAVRDSQRIGFISKELKSRRSKGLKVFTSAYTISTCGQKMDKIDYVVEVLDRVNQYIPTCWPRDTLDMQYRDLICVKGLGSFLAGQIIADLKNTPGHRLQHAKDFDAWSVPGPGSLRGLTEYFGFKVTPHNYQAKIMVAWDEVRPLLPDYVGPLHMQDFQNCLCEFSKYQRVRAGGHARNKYHAEEAL